MSTEELQRSEYFKENRNKVNLEDALQSIYRELGLPCPPAAQVKVRMKAGSHCARSQSVRGRPEPLPEEKLYDMAPSPSLREKEALYSFEETGSYAAPIPDFYDTSSDFYIFLSSLENETGPSFSEEVKRYMEEKNLTSAKVYREAQVLKQTFSKIKTYSKYQPARDTAIQICFALHLSFEQAEELIERAGYTFSSSSKRDLCFKYLFEHKVYNIVKINLLLDQLDERILGKSA